MIEKFKFEEDFLTFIWSGFEAIASIPEKEDSKRFSMLEASQMRTLKTLGSGVFNAWKAEQDADKVSLWAPHRFCIDIRHNRDEAKILCLDFARKLCETYFKVSSILVFFGMI